MQVVRVCVTVREMRRRVLACSALIATIAILAAQLAGSAHEAVACHVRCAHGELVEAPAVAAHRAEDRRVVAVEAGGGGDAHCAIAAAASQSGAAPAAARALAPRPDALVRPAPAPAFADPAHAALYRIAPKTSPPATLV
jgi:hypothetical protein